MLDALSFTLDQCLSVVHSRILEAFEWGQTKVLQDEKVCSAAYFRAFVI